MPIPMYLAMTAAEIATCTHLPPEIGWMACHFSPSGPGLSNVPEMLQKGSVLMVDDSMPFQNHDPDMILQQLQNAVDALETKAVLLDFQRPDVKEVKQLVALLTQGLSCPVIAPSGYGEKNHPVFLPPCPLNQPLNLYLAPYQGREIWLETAMDGLTITVTANGSRKESWIPENTEVFSHKENDLHCHYRIAETSDGIAFFLQRTYPDLKELLQEADSLGVSHAIGLWQEIKKPPVG